MTAEPIARPSIKSATIPDCDRELRRLTQERRSAEGVTYVQISREIDRWLDFRSALMSRA